MNEQSFDLSPRRRGSLWYAATSVDSEFMIDCEQTEYTREPPSSHQPAPTERQNFSNAKRCAGRSRDASAQAAKILISAILSGS